MTIKNHALKPCPFCGSTNVAVNQGLTAAHTPWFHVQCGDCLATGDSVEAWNRRVEVPLLAELDQLRKTGPTMQRGVTAAGMPLMGTMLDVLNDYKAAASVEADEVDRLQSLGLGNGYYLPLTALNEAMQSGFETLLAHARRARWTNAVVRKDGMETTYEADWIKHMVKV